MKSPVFILLLMAVVGASCKPKETNNNETSIHARADSAVGARMQEINQQAMDDLEKRMAIEVKAKADSIIAARKNGLPAAVKDTTVATRVSDRPVRPAINAVANDTASH